VEPSPIHHGTKQTNKKNEKIAKIAKKKLKYIHSAPGFLTCGASPDAPQLSALPMAHQTMRHDYMLTLSH
jgi:hypothetical protein